MKIKGYDVEAIIFDLDGTLIDSNRVWEDIDKVFFGKRNITIPDDFGDRIAHIGLRNAAIYIKETFNLKESIEDILKEWDDSARYMYENVIQLKPGVSEFLKLVKENGILTAVATVNSPSLYIPCLRRLGVLDYFDYLMDVTESKVGKGDNKMFSLLSSKFNKPIGKTMVFEDIPTPLKTAYEHGYITVGIDDPSSISLRESKKKFSHFYIKDFTDLI